MKISFSKIKSFLLAATICVGVSACSDDDDSSVVTPVTPATDATTVQLSMGENYGTQMYYDIESNKVLATNAISDWTLAFANGASDRKITLNYATGARAMKIVDCTYDNLDLAYADKLNLDNFQYDTDETPAIDGWYSDGNVVSNLYLIHNGTDVSGEDLGFSKITVTAYNGSSYTIKYADLSQGTSHEETITKSGNATFRFLDIPNSTVKDLEPNGQWDLLFTKYTTYVTMGGESTWHSVVGVLIKTPGTTGALMPDTVFNDVTLASLDNVTLTSQRDVIGYNWKSISMSTMLYTADPTMIYAIRTDDDNTFALHFTDFYDESGIKGAPKFEFKKL